MINKLVTSWFLLWYGYYLFNFTVIYKVMSPTSTVRQSHQAQTVTSTTADTFQSPEVMHYVDSRWLIWIMLIIILEMATPLGILFPTDAIVFGWGMYFSAKWTVWWGIWMIMLLFSIAVVMGDILWYWRWTLLAPKIQTLQDNRFFKRKYITICQQYFDEYGRKTIIISKFLPIRSMIPLVAGIIQKKWSRFIWQSILSAILRVGSLLWASYFIIWLIPAAANHIGLLTFLFVVIPQIVSVRYMILPMIKKYETRLVETSDNFHHIIQEVSVIWSEFVAIGHEVGQIVKKVVSDNNIDHSWISRETHTSNQNSSLPATWDIWMVISPSPQFTSQQPEWPNISSSGEVS